MKSVTLVKRNKQILSVVRNIHRKTKIKVSSHKKNSDEEDFFRITRIKFVKELLRNGFEFYNSGGYKTLYQHPKYPEFLVKVHRGCYGYEGDTNISKLPKFLKKHFLQTIVRNRLYMIQPKANGKRGKWKERPDNALYSLLKNNAFAKIAKDYDVSTDNVKYHNGDPVIIDFCV